MISQLVTLQTANSVLSYPGLSRIGMLFMLVSRKDLIRPLTFLLCINDIITDIGSNIRLFADDTSIYIIVNNRNIAAGILNQGPVVQN